jgi:hypothetical protein
LAYLKYFSGWYDIVSVLYANHSKYDSGTTTVNMLRVSVTANT